MLRDVIPGAMKIVNFFPSRPSGNTECQILARQVQVFLKHRNYHIVIFALRQPGNGNRTHASRARENYWETAAVRRVVFWIEAGFRLQSGLGPLVREANSVRTAVIALDDIAFAANPVRVVRRGSGHGVRK